MMAGGRVGFVGVVGLAACSGPPVNPPDPASVVCQMKPPLVTSTAGPTWRLLYGQSGDPQASHRGQMRPKVAVDGDGSIFVAGVLAPEESEITTLRTEEVFGPYLGRLDVQGGLRWIVGHEVTPEVTGATPALVRIGTAPGQRGVVVTGNARASHALLPSGGLVPADVEAPFIARFDESGALQWARVVPADAAPTDMRVVLDDGGRSWVLLGNQDARSIFTFEANGTLHAVGDAYVDMTVSSSFTEPAIAVRAPGGQASDSIHAVVDSHGVGGRTALGLARIDFDAQVVEHWPGPVVVGEAGYVGGGMLASGPEGVVWEFQSFAGTVAIDGHVLARSDHPAIADDGSRSKAGVLFEAIERDHPRVGVVLDPGTGELDVDGLAVDAREHVWLMGRFHEFLRVGDVQLHAERVGPTIIDKHSFLAELSPTGEVLWARVLARSGLPGSLAAGASGVVASAQTAFAYVWPFTDGRTPPVYAPRFGGVVFMSPSAP